MRRILIVDDEPGIRESLEDFFQDEGFVVATARDGAEALARLAERPLPHVVVLDLRMPKFDGNEVYQRMQNDAQLAQVPVIVSTSDPGYAPSGVLIMKKPINLERLLCAVLQHCEDDVAANDTGEH